MDFTHINSCMDLRNRDNISGHVFGTSFNIKQRRLLPVFFVEYCDLNNYNYGQQA